MALSGQTIDQSPKGGALDVLKRLGCSYYFCPLGACIGEHGALLPLFGSSFAAAHG